MKFFVSGTSPGVCQRSYWGAPVRRLKAPLTNEYHKTSYAESWYLTSLVSVPQAVEKVVLWCGAARPVCVSGCSVCELELYCLFPHAIPNICLLFYLEHTKFKISSFFIQLLKASFYFLHLVFEFFFYFENIFLHKMLVESFLM